MKNKIILLFFLSSILFFKVCFGNDSLISPINNSIKNILVLDSYNVNYRWSRNVINGVIDRFSKYNKEVIINVEHLDQRAYAETFDFKTIAQIIKSKYIHINFDIIIASDNPSFNFIKEYRDLLFPGVPIVFCGYNNLNQNDLNGIKNITGINEEIHISQSIDLMKSIHSKLQSVIFISSSKDLSFNTYVNKINTYIKNDKSKIQYYNFIDINAKDLKTKLKSFSKNTAILIFGSLSDEAKPSKSTQIITKLSPFPVYSNWDYALNNGIVGGIIVNGYVQGSQVAELAIRILNGEKADQIPLIMETPSAKIFDYKALYKFNISLSSLPDDCQIINEPYNLWDSHKPLLITIIIFIVILITVIIILLFINTQKNLIRKNLLKTELQLTQISKNLINGFIYQIDTGVACESKKFTFISDTVYNFLGLTKEEVYSNYNALYDLVHPEDIFKLYETEKNAVKKMSMFRFEGRLITKEGKIKYFLCTSIPQRNKENHIVWDGLTIDIEVLKKTEEELIQSKLKAEESNRLITAFLANLGHEIRTPMNGIMGFMNILKTFNFNKSDRDQYVNSFNESAKRFLTTLNDLILVSEIQSSNKIEINNSKISVNGLMQNLYDQYSNQILSKSISYTWDTTDWSNDIMIYSDIEKLNKILSNLVLNAIKYTYSGKVVISCHKQENFILFKVQDTGIGIPKENLKQVFDLFVQVEMDSDRFYEGTGLGLSITKAYVELLGGEIGVESEENMGSTFYFTIPIN
jgi:two-component system, sensor histidine kinase